MKRKYTKKRIQELAASYSLGALEREERELFEELLSEGHEHSEKELMGFNDVVKFLGLGVTPMAPPSELKSRLFQPLEDSRHSQPPSTAESGFLFVRSNEGEWVEVVKGVKVKDLYTDSERRYSTVLVQMDPGAGFPEHRHVETEECYIISGDLHMGGQVFHAGDYVRAEADSIHEGIYSENGCTLLVAASQENEIIG